MIEAPGSEVLFRLEGLGKHYAGGAALAEVELEVRRGEFVCLVGPSGAGKTTLLSIVAGLLPPDQGRVVFSRPPSRQEPVILVFQDYLLFPNLTVAENVAFGLRARHLPRGEIADRVAEQLAWFGLSDKADQYPAELSAGQKQRVAIARALVVRPALLLLDEPFANLDRNLKGETARFLRRTQRRFGLTVVAVTHDLEEAYVLADRLGVMMDGRLMQYGPPAEVYHRPASAAVAAFLGPINILPPGLPGGLDLDGQRLARPEQLAMILDQGGDGLVVEQTFTGPWLLSVVRLGGRDFTIYGPENGIAVGDRVRLRLLASPAEQGDRL